MGTMGLKKSIIQLVGGLSILILCVIFFPFFCIGIYAEIYEIQKIYEQFPQWITDPLQPSVAQNLCSILKFDIKTDQRCQKEVYAIAFFSDLQTRYLGMDPINVNNEIGTYLVKCDDWVDTESDGSFRDCFYDFQGDGRYLLVITYQKGLNHVTENSFEKVDKVHQTSIKLPIFWWVVDVKDAFSMDVN